MTYRIVNVRTATTQSVTKLITLKLESESLRELAGMVAELEQTLDIRFDLNSPQVTLESVHKLSEREREAFIDWKQNWKKQDKK